MATSSGSNTYPKRLGAGTAIDGHELEIYLSMLVWLRAKAVKKITSFEIATNVNEIGCFDDVVAKCEYNDDIGHKRKHFLFLQSKHISEPNNEYKQITWQSVVVGPNIHKDNFRLSKYYKEYTKLLASMGENLKIKFNEKGDKIELVIYTNGKIEDELINYLLEIETEPSIIDINNGKKYQLTKTGKRGFRSKIIWDYNLEENQMKDVECFLDTIRLLEGQPDLQILVSNIKKEIKIKYPNIPENKIDDIFNMAHEKFKKVWKKQKIGEYLTQQNIYFFESWLQICNKILKEEIEGKKRKIDHFKEHLAQCELTRILLNQDYQIIDIITSKKCYQLSATKIKQIFESTNKDDHLFIDSKTLTEHELDISEVFNSDICNIIVLLIIPETLKINISNILEVLKFKKDKKCIILHSSGEFNVEKICGNTQYIKLQEQEFELHQFSKQFREDFSSYQITVHGKKKMKIGDVLLKNDGNLFLPDIDLTDIILKFINNDEINFAKEDRFGLTELERTTYVVRELLSITEIEKRIFHEKELQNDIVVIKISDHKTAECYVDDSFEVFMFPCECGPFKNIFFIKKSGQIDELLKKNRGKNIHILEFRTQTLHWLHTHGSIEKILKYMVKDTTNNVCQFESDICENADIKFVIISDSAGTGKTTVLQYIAWLLFEKDHENFDSIVITIPLNIHTQYFDDKTHNMSDKGSVIDFLFMTLQLEYEYERHVLKSLLEKKKVFIILDGFDEISPNYEEEVLALIRSLKSSVKQMWIACRPHVISTLQKTLNVVSYSLKQLTKDDKVKYVVKIFKSNGVKKDSEQLYCECASKIIDKIDEKDSKHKRPMSSFPLHLDMIAHIFSDYVKSSSDVSDIVLPSLADMYSKFVSHKIEWYNEKKLSGNRNTNLVSIKLQSKILEPPLCENHQYVAMKILLNESRKNCLLAEYQVEKFDETLSNTSYYTPYGLFEIVNENKIKFLHQTIAEYFLACFIKKKCKLDQSQNYQNFVMHDLLKVDELKVVRSFLNDFCKSEPIFKIQNIECLLSNDLNFTYESITPIRKAVSENNEYILSQLLSSFKKMEIVTNILLMERNEYDIMTSVIYKALEKNNINIIEVLTKYVNVKHTFFGGDTLLHEAARCCDKVVVMHLVDLDPDVTAINDRKETALHLANSRGKFDIVKYLVEKGADVTAADTDGKTFLHCDAKFDNIEFVEYLVKKRADFTAADTDGKTVLHHAVKYQSVDTVKYMVRIGANVTAADKDGVTVLHHAVQYQSLDTIQHLVDKGADVNAADKDGVTVLHHAVQYQSLDTIQYLVDKGADVNAADKDGVTVLYNAVRHQRLNIIKYLVDKQANVTATDKDGVLVLYRAIRYDKLEVIKYLVNNGADYTAKNKYVCAILYFAARNNCPSIVTYLVGKGADANAANVFGDTLLHCVARNNDLDTVKYLEKNGAVVTAADNKGLTVLHCAVRYGCLDIVKYLVVNNAVVNVANNAGETVLHHAVQYDKLDNVKYLVEKGADVSAVDRYYITVLHCTIGNNNLEIVEYLLKNGADLTAADSIGRTVLHYAVEYGNVETIKYLVEQGADVTAVDESDATVLHLAAATKYLNTVKYLIQKGADVNAIDLDGKTVLHCYASFDDLDVIKYLVEEKKTNFNASDNDGHTVLHCAVKSESINTVKYLVDKGAEVNSKTKKGKTALHYAAKYSIKVVEYLVDNSAKLDELDYRRMTAYDYAVENENTDVADYLMQIERCTSYQACKRRRLAPSMD